MTSYITRLKTVFSSLPTFLAALVPVFKSCPPCPICMPKYAAILSLLGLELADYSQYLMPIMLVSMAVTLVVMHHQRRSKDLPIYPTLLALVSFIGILTSKYLFFLEALAYVFMASLLVSIVWQQMNIKKAKTCCGHHHA